MYYGRNDVENGQTYMNNAGWLFLFPFVARRNGSGSRRRATPQGKKPQTRKAKNPPLTLIFEFF